MKLVEPAILARLTSALLKARGQYNEKTNEYYWQYAIVSVQIFPEI